MPFDQGGPVTDYKSEVGKGWHPLLDELDAELRETVPGYQVFQVKEKFGELRVYLQGGTFPPAWEIIEKYTIRSRTVCEYCGEPGTHRQDRWWRTLCDPCEERHQIERNNKWKTST